MLLDDRKAGRPFGAAAQSSRPDFHRVEEILEAIGREIDLWQSGVQGERQARARIARLVAIGKNLARAASQN